jgi:hypothetical protein
MPFREKRLKVGVLHGCSLAQGNPVSSSGILSVECRFRIFSSERERELILDLI